MEFAQATLGVSKAVASKDVAEGIDGAVKWYTAAKELRSTVGEIGNVGKFPVRLSAKPGVPAGQEWLHMMQIANH